MADPIEPLLWEKHFERHPPDSVWLQRLTETIAILGFKIESFMAAYAQSKEKPDPADWFWWEKSDTAGAAADGQGLDFVSEEDIRAAWGAAYDTIMSEGVSE